TTPTVLLSTVVPSLTTPRATAPRSRPRIDVLALTVSPTWAATEPPHLVLTVSAAATPGIPTAAVAVAIAVAAPSAPRLAARRRPPPAPHSSRPCSPCCLHL